MANQRAASMTLHAAPGVELIIWYNDANLRIGALEWNIPVSGIVARLRVWDSNVSTTTPVIDRTEGQGSGSENVPSNYRMELVDDPDQGQILEFPPNISYTFNIETVG